MVLGEGPDRPALRVGGENLMRRGRERRPDTGIEFRPNRDRTSTIRPRHFSIIREPDTGVYKAGIA